MTLDDMQAVTDIMVRADGGCSTCVAELMGALEAKFPQFAWSAEADREITVQPDWSEDPEDARTFDSYTVKEKA